MHFNEHYKLKDAHAFLSPSNYHWMNYDEDKLIARFRSSQEAARGTRLHALAAELIRLRIKQARNNKSFNAYVNDAIGYRMSVEQILFYSENAFGTVDAISFAKDRLRIHDLKNGVTPANMNQLRVYAALFFLEYDINPNDVKTELRIYQSDEIIAEEPEIEDLFFIMDRIVTFDRIVKVLKEQEDL